MTIRTHTDEEIKKIEMESLAEFKRTGRGFPLIFSHWERTGGPFMDVLEVVKDRKTGIPSIREGPNHAGPITEVPVFKRKI